MRRRWARRAQAAAKGGRRSLSQLLAPRLQVGLRLACRWQHTSAKRKMKMKKKPGPRGRGRSKAARDVGNRPNRSWPLGSRSSLTKVSWSRRATSCSTGRARRCSRTRRRAWLDIFAPPKTRPLCRGSRKCKQQIGAPPRPCPNSSRTTKTSVRGVSASVHAACDDSCSQFAPEVFFGALGYPGHGSSCVMVQ